MMTTRMMSIALVGVLAMPAPALAERASQLTMLNGMNGPSAENMLRQRGFTLAANNSNAMGYTYTYWWKDADRTCVQVEARGGTVMTVNDANAAKDCHHGGGGNAAAAVGVVAGAAILGALLSHKSHHHDNNQHLSDQQAEQSYERGYQDGLYNGAYHNPDRQDSYSSGYSAGVDQRNANLSTRTGRGGYARAVEIGDLKDARAAGGMDELMRRGFRQVDNFATGTTRYSIQWQPQTRQCVQVTIADGRFYDIRDIGQHPKCR